MDTDLITIFVFVLLLVGMVRFFPRRGSGLSQPDAAALGEARALAGRLETRIDALERILDEDAPGWRSRARQG